MGRTRRPGPSVNFCEYCGPALSHFMFVLKGFDLVQVNICSSRWIGSTSLMCKWILWVSAMGVINDGGRKGLSSQCSKISLGLESLQDIARFSFDVVIE